MLKTRIRRQTASGARALTLLAEIQASIVALNDEDLLDLADIFPARSQTLLGEVAAAEVARRNITA